MCSGVFSEQPPGRGFVEANGMKTQAYFLLGRNGNYTRDAPFPLWDNVAIETDRERAFEMFGRANGNIKSGDGLALIAWSILWGATALVWTPPMQASDLVNPGMAEELTYFEEAMFQAVLDYMGHGQVRPDKRDPLITRVWEELH